MIEYISDITYRLLKSSSWHEQKPVRLLRRMKAVIDLLAVVCRGKTYPSARCVPLRAHEFPLRFLTFTCRLWWSVDKQLIISSSTSVELRSHVCLAIVWRSTRSQAVARIADTAPLGVTWRHLSRDHLMIAHVPFPIGPLNQASISNGFRDIQRRMWRNGRRDLDTTSKQRLRSINHFGTNRFSYDFIGLSIVTFALVRTVEHHVTDDDRRRQTTDATLYQ